jgi:methionyl-tRNA synthetase
MNDNNPIAEENTIAYATIADLGKVKVAIGTIITADFIEGSEKLLKLSVDLGETDPRQILSGIRAYYPDPLVLVGVQTTFVINLAPRTMMGFESQGMLYAGGNAGELVLLRPDRPVAPGTPMH